MFEETLPLPGMVLSPAAVTTFGNGVSPGNGVPAFSAFSASIPDVTAAEWKLSGTNG